MMDNNQQNKLNAAIMESVMAAQKLGYTVLYCANYGSHNYNLDIDDEEYKSDIDTKAIILPTLEELVHNSKPVSTTIEISTGQCDIKDIRAFTETLLKANIQFLEILCARAYWINEDYKEDFEWFINNLEQLVKGSRTQLLKSIYGMSLEKQKALCHPYPTIKWKIDKWGYDGKQLHHIKRLYDFIDEYFFHHKSFKESIWYQADSGKRVFLLSLKLNRMSLDRAKFYSKLYCDAIKNKVERFLLSSYKTDEQIKAQYAGKANEIIIKNIKKKILEEQ